MFNVQSALAEMGNSYELDENIYSQLLFGGLRYVNRTVVAGVI